MLTRLYIDNFKCFANFEYKPARRQLILGANGSGKSSLIEVLSLLHRFAVRGEDVSSLKLTEQRTRWLDQLEQTFQIEALLKSGRYVYRIVIDQRIEQPRVKLETVELNKKPLLEFSRGNVRLYNDSFKEKHTYPINWSRSALATAPEDRDVQKLTQFRHWLRGVVCFRLNPFAMEALATTADANPAPDLSNLSSWYRHLEPFAEQNIALTDELQTVLNGFVGLQLWEAGNARVLGAEFRAADHALVKFVLSELSEGQRCIICLYAILHFVLTRGNTVIIDEPDNFISLREIQPWLIAATDTVEDSKGQLLLISHHPELINQWAPEGGVRFVRDGAGPVRVEEFRGDPNSALSPAELVARGWEDG